MTKNRLQLLIFIIVVPVGVFFWYLHTNEISLREFVYPAPWMRIGDLPLKVELAVTQDERIQGLSRRSALEGVDGLLFVFPESEYHGIWMKDMQFPIDIIWINEERSIVHIEQNVHPDTYPKVFRPRVPARYVLETNVHYVDTFGISVGQEVTLPPEVLE